MTVSPKNYKELFVALELRKSIETNVTKQLIDYVIYYPDNKNPNELFEITTQPKFAE